MVYMIVLVKMMKKIATNKRLTVYLVPMEMDRERNLVKQVYPVNVLVRMLLLPLLLVLLKQRQTNAYTHTLW